MCAQTWTKTGVAGIERSDAAIAGLDRVLTPEALAFLATLQRTFDLRRQSLLALRQQRQQCFDAGEKPDFLAETAAIRAGDWQVAPVPADLQDRRVEITGPVERKMMINALNSGARAFMADFEDANSPTWTNVIEGQANLLDAVDRTLALTFSEGKIYRLNAAVATLLVRPRGWHLPERHLRVDGAPMSGSLFDFGLYVFHNASLLLKQGTGPYFYLPKLESRLEARLWNDVFDASEAALGLTPGAIKATVLIETLPAVFEMDEILYELRNHIVALNAGRWDYIFSSIKKLHRHPDALLPDRAQVLMTVPFMRAYTELLVKTCHRRGAHAIGGMAAFIPNRRDPEVTANALARVRQDKQREAGDGFDGTWVAHPDLVPVALDVFDRVLGKRPHQKDRMRSEVQVNAAHLLDFAVPDGRITEAGVRSNLDVALRYLESWLRGQGAVAIHNLMEDAATAEIARTQLWQWVHHANGRLDDGRRVSRELVCGWLAEKRDRLQAEWGAAAFAASKAEPAAALLEHLITTEKFVDFLTLPAYESLD